MNILQKPSIRRSPTSLLLFTKNKINIMSFTQYYQVMGERDYTFSVKRLQQEFLQTEHIGRYFYHVQETSSTMDLLDALIQPSMKKPSDNSGSSNMEHKAQMGAPTGLTVLADKQTAGRGRKGRTWQSNDAENIYVSILFRVEFGMFDQLIKLNLGLALAIVRTCHDFGIKDAGIKWPNDVWAPVNEKENGEYGPYRKLSGMLVNTSQIGNEVRAICGIGLNVNESLRSSELSLTAISMSDIVGKKFLREQVLASICNHLEKVLSMNMEEMLLVYKQHDILTGKRIMVHQSDQPPVEAVAIGYSKFGNLQVQFVRDGTVKELISEEVSIRL